MHYLLQALLQSFGKGKGRKFPMQFAYQEKGKANPKRLSQNDCHHDIPINIRFRYKPVLSYVSKMSARSSWHYQQYTYISTQGALWFQEGKVMLQISMRTCKYVSNKISVWALVWLTKPACRADLCAECGYKCVSFVTCMTNLAHKFKLATHL